MVRPYRVSDWSAIVDSYQAEFLALRNKPEQVIDSGPAYTYEKDGVPLLAGGVCPYWPGVGVGWIIASPTIREHPVLLGLLASRVFIRLIQKDFWRVEAIARLDRPDTHRFLIRLGFTIEGVARQYGPDRSDFLRFAWVRRK